ncbi:hypothetical protein BJV78DRAFT_1126957, partial [Lactifluus subvellereus]
ANGVGSIVVQLAKQEGYRAIASVGTDKGVAWLRTLGADIAFDYKTRTGDMRTALLREGPIDIKGRFLAERGATELDGLRVSGIA